MTDPLYRVPPARSWARACAAVLLALQVLADGAAAMPHPGDYFGVPASLESHHGAQCVRIHDAAQCVQCQYHATRPLPSAERRIRLGAQAGLQIGRREHPRSVVTRSRVRATPPRAPPQLSIHS